MASCDRGGEVLCQPGKEAFLKVTLISAHVSANQNQTRFNLQFFSFTILRFFSLVKWKSKIQKITTEKSWNWKTEISLNIILAEESGEIWHKIKADDNIVVKLPKPTVINHIHMKLQTTDDRLEILVFIGKIKQN